jgi:hypothetical protein
MRTAKTVRNILLLAAMVLCTSLTAKAQFQPHAEVFGGYSYMRYNPTGVDVNLNGWNASVNFKLFPVLGIVGDFAGDYGSPGGISSSVHTYMFGPQFSLPSRVSPFAHILFGGGHLNVSGATDNSYAMEFGGGIDVRATHNLGFRLFELDDVYTRFGGFNQNNARASAGIVLRF